MTATAFNPRVYARQAKAQMQVMEITEDGLALEFTRRHAHELRYVALWGAWLRWSETIWRKETTLEAYDLARAVCRDAAEDVDKGRTRILSSATRAAVENLARADRAHAATIEQWDRDLYAIAMPEGHEP